MTHIVLKWDRSGSERRELDGKRQRCMRSWQCHIWLRHGVTQWIHRKNNNKKNIENYSHPIVIYPLNTCDTAVWVCGMPRCAEIHYCTLTRATRFGKPAGFPVPVTIPTCTGQKLVSTHLLNNWNWNCGADTLKKGVFRHNRSFGWNRVGLFGGDVYSFDRQNPPLLSESRGSRHLNASWI